jgi:lysophospholipid acyltransferase
VLEIFLEALGWITVYMLVYPHFDMEYIRTDAYLALPWWRVALYNFISVTLIRSKYFFAWKLSDCSVTACGLSYNGKIEGKNGVMVDDFSLIPNIDPWNFEMSPHIRVKIRSWNMSVQAWLTKCVYYRYRTAE